MSYTAPTVSDFQARFSEFEDVDDDVIQATLDEAARFVDDTWVDADRFNGNLFLAAHYIQTAAGAYDTGGLQSITVGSISVTYSQIKGIASLDKTSYGTRFRTLQSLNRRGPRVA